MKPLASKPSDACGLTPILAFLYLDASGAAIKVGHEAEIGEKGTTSVPLCGTHMQEAQAGGLATAVNLADPRLTASQGLACQQSIGRKVQPLPPPAAPKTAGKK